MREHIVINEVQDEEHFRVVEGVLGTVDQPTTNRCIMKEMKQYHGNLAVVFYDYKKAYDTIHDWMLQNKTYTKHFANLVMDS